MEIRGFPQLVYYASADEQASGGDDAMKVKAYKHQGERTLQALEDFAINGGYKKVGLSAYFPLD